MRDRGLAIRIGRALVVAAGIAGFLGLALRTVPTTSHVPWDFATYWYAGVAASQGLSPYETDRLSQLAQMPLGMPFLYPPITVPLVIPLTLLPLGIAARVWFAAKLLLLVALVLLWRRYFLRDMSLLLLAGVAVLGFNAGSLWDLRAGNVAILEQFLLWAGFAAFLLERRYLFVLCVISASLFKLFPIAFLGLLLVPSRNGGPQWKLVGGALVLFACLVFIPTIAGPAWARGFLHNVPAERPWGLVNPSALGLIDTLLGDHTTPLTAPPFRALGPFLLYELAIVALSIPTLRRLWRQRSAREWVLAGAILYALLVPRLMVYSYLLVLVPVLALFTPVVSRFGGYALGAGLITLQALLGRVLKPSYGAVWAANLSFLMLVGFWLVYLLAGAKYSGAYSGQTGEAVPRQSQVRSSSKGGKQRRGPDRHRRRSR